MMDYFYFYKVMNSIRGSDILYKSDSKLKAFLRRGGAVIPLQQDEERQKRSIFNRLLFTGDATMPITVNRGFFMDFIGMNLKHAWRVNEKKVYPAYVGLPVPK